MFSLLGRGHRRFLRPDGGRDLIHAFFPEDDSFERAYGGVRTLQRRADGHGHIHAELALMNLGDQFASEPGDQAEPAQCKKERGRADHEGLVPKRPADETGIHAGDRAECEVKETQQREKDGEQDHGDEAKDRDD